MTTVRVAEDALSRRVLETLVAAGAAAAPAEAATRAMMHASRLGIDSHGVRLTEHYCEMMAKGRIDPDPVLAVRRTGPAAAVVDAGNGLGHYAAYRAIAVGVEIAAEAGVAAVGVVRSSHYGAAGAYALAGAEAGLVAFATTNSDSLVALRDGAEVFHGTNPLAFAAPVPGEAPWLFDMATSSIPYNRVLLNRSLGAPLPEGVAADAGGAPTTDPHLSAMLLPLGGPDFGHKGAGLAGVATVLSAVLMGMTLDRDFTPMYGGDETTPRGMGHCFILIDPERFAGREAYAAGIRRYLGQLRASPARPGASVMAPGDREWHRAEERRRHGIPIDPDTARYLGFA